MGDEGHPPSPSPTGCRRVVWISSSLLSAADIVKNTVMPDLTFVSKIAVHSGFWEL